MDRFEIEDVRKITLLRSKRPREIIKKLKEIVNRSPREVIRLYIRNERKWSQKDFVGECLPILKHFEVAVIKRRSTRRRKIGPRIRRNVIQKMREVL